MWCLKHCLVSSGTVSGTSAAHCLSLLLLDSRAFYIFASDTDKRGWERARPSPPQNSDKSIICDPDHPRHLRDAKAQKTQAVNSFRDKQDSDVVHVSP